MKEKTAVVKTTKLW